MNTLQDDSAFPSPFPPLWALAWGEDEFGLYAEFEVAGAAQRCRWMPPGRFLMGSPEDEPRRESEEGPQHKVTLSGYWLADTACSQAMWQAVTGNNPSEFKDSSDNPVDFVSWDTSQDFFDKLNALVPGLGAGFPTEAQWEYACRARSITPFSFGDNIAPEQVNYNGTKPYGGGEKGLCWEKTVPVGSLPPNPWGLFEMHGNLWEWCADWFGSYAEEPQTDPEGPSQGTYRILRGGSWIDGARYVRSAYRNRSSPGIRKQYFGLRIAPGRAKPAEPA